ncbi:Nmad5 family putative nucleotide modification protein, partial [Sphingomonas sp.]
MRWAPLSKFTSVKRLLDAWPEAKELLPDRLP